MGMMRDFCRDKCISLQRKTSGLGRTMGRIRLASFGLFVLIFSQIETGQDPVGTETFQTDADQGRGYSPQERSSPETTVLPWGRVPALPQDTHHSSFELFYRTETSNQWKMMKYLVKQSSFQREGQFDNHKNHRSSCRDHLRPG